MDAMSVSTRGRYVVLLARDTTYSASLAFTIAHELGHIALGHVRPDETVIDDGDPVSGDAQDDNEEQAASAWASELLTGNRSFAARANVDSFTATQLAEASLTYGLTHNIDPGVIALSTAFTMDKWEVGYGALKVLNELDGQPRQMDTDLAKTVNGIALSQLNLQQVSDERATYLRRIMAATL
jgi:hypothetical protein